MCVSAATDPNSVGFHQRRVVVHADEIEKEAPQELKPCTRVEQAYLYRRSTRRHVLQKASGRKAWQLRAGRPKVLWNIWNDAGRLCNSAVVIL